MTPFWHSRGRPSSWLTKLIELIRFRGLTACDIRRIFYVLHCFIFALVMCSCSKGWFYSREFYFPPSNSDQFTMRAVVSIEYWGKGPFAAYSKKKYTIKVFDSHGNLLGSAKGNVDIGDVKLTNLWDDPAKPVFLIFDKDGREICRVELTLISPSIRKP